MQSRIEQDSLGDVAVPADRLYGAQTQRAVENFRFSKRRLPAQFIVTLAHIKAAAATANAALGTLDASRAEAIITAAARVAAGEYLDHFPIDVFQTGSATSTNMNMNEVLARLAGEGVHPNDHVNQSQSSNDVIPACIQASALLELEQHLLPAARGLTGAIKKRAAALEQVIKTGRTHLMDAMPLSVGQELTTWACQVDDCVERIEAALPALRALPLGGTAIGTGVNADAAFAGEVCRALSARLATAFTPAVNASSRMAAQDVALHCSAGLRSLAVVLMKICTDLRWMASGPVAGLGEIQLKALAPGSSIMPAKVNPIIPEAVSMIAAEIMGNDMTITVAAQSGNFQLNVMLPLIAEKLLTSVGLLANACPALEATIRDCQVNTEHLQDQLARNPVLVTALNARIGYARGAEIAKRAYRENRALIDVAVEETDISREELARLLDPAALAYPHK